MNDIKNEIKINENISGSEPAAKNAQKKDRAAVSPEKNDENDVRKNIKNVKGTLFRWTDDSADWYETASEYTGYHDRLTEIIAPHLDSEYTCCELACGTGTLARHLAPYVKSYTANDIDHHATDHLADMISDGSCPNLDIIEGDWHDVFAGKKFNAAVFSFFGAVEQDWDALSELVTDRIIVISPRSRTGKMKLAAENEADKSTEASGSSAKQASDSAPSPDPEKPQRIIRGKARSFETGPSIAEFLDKNDISYIRKDVDLEFGQPFDNLSQARDYTRYYYKLDERDIDIFLQKKLERLEDGRWYFPKTKELSVIIIDMTTVK